MVIDVLRILWNLILCNLFALIYYIGLKATLRYERTIKMNCCLNWEKLTSELILWSSNPYAIEAIQCSLVWWSNLVLLDLSAKRSSPAPVRQKSVQKQKLKRRRLYRFKNRQSYDLALVHKKRKVWREMLTINWCYGRNKVRKYGRFVTLWLKTWRKRLWSCCWKWMVKKFPPEKARLVPCLVPPWAAVFSGIAMIRFFHQ